MSEYHLHRVFCEVKDNVTQYFSIRPFGDPYFLEPCTCYTQMPYPLLRFYERAFYHARSWTVKLLGLSNGSAKCIEKNEVYVMSLERPKEKASKELHEKLLHMRYLFAPTDIDLMWISGRYVIRVFSSISDENLARLLLTLMEEETEEDFGKGDFTIKSWCELSEHHGYPAAFRPGFWQAGPGGGRIYVRFLNPAATATIQQDGWQAKVFSDSQSKAELTVAISKDAILALFDRNLMTFSRYLSENLEYQGQKAAENHDSLPWRNLVYRVLNDLLPGYWDVCKSQKAVAFTVEVPS